MNEKLSSMVSELKRTGQYDRLKDFRQHGSCSVYDHSLNVADTALRLARRLPIKVDEEALARGALLHDYFMYDWHIPDRARPNHAFFHPRMAWENASRDYDLGDTEKDIIRRHMFPVVPMPPKTREGWIVCIADKLCALEETLFNAAAKRKTRKIDGQEEEMK